MKKYIVGALVVFASLVGIVSSEAIIKQVGMKGQCDTTNSGCIPIPLNLSIVCNGTAPAGNNCPQYWSPDWSDTNSQKAYGYTNQVSPGRCLKSVDAAATWQFCTTDPFTSTFSSLPVVFAATRYGELLAAVNVNNTTQSCVIKKSYDGGISWSTVYTQNGTYACSAWSNAVMPSPMKCAKNGNICVLYGYDIAGSAFRTAWYSNTNGDSWTPTNVTESGAPANPPIIGSAISSDGTITITGNVTGNATRNFFYSRDGSTFVGSANWGTAVGASACGGAFIYNSDPAVICGANNSTQTWQVVRINGTTPETIGQFTLGNGSPLSGNSPNMIGIQWSTSVFYLITRLHATSATNIYVTNNSFSTMNFIGTLTPTTGYSGNPVGDIYLWRDGIYWSSGFYTPTGHIMKVGL